MAELSAKELLKEIKANAKEMKRVNEMIELGALSGSMMQGVPDLVDLKRKDRQLRALLKQKYESFKEQQKVFSTTMIAQQARKEATKVAEQKALASEKPVLKVTKTRVAYSPRVPEPTE